MTVSTSDLLRRSPLLVERWNLRRREAVEMLALAVREGDLEGAALDDLATAVHRIAGTAGLFGEASFGIRAAELERAIRRDAPAEERLKLAREMLAAA